MAITLDPKREYTEAEIRRLTRQWKARQGYHANAKSDLAGHIIFWIVLYGLGIAIILSGYAIATRPQ